MRLRVRALVLVTGLLSTLDILRATRLAGIGTLPCGQVAEVSSGRNPRPLLMWSGYLRVRHGAYTARAAKRPRPRAAARRAAAGTPAGTPSTPPLPLRGVSGGAA